jgi:hypothetical protein
MKRVRNFRLMGKGDTRSPSMRMQRTEKIRRCVAVHKTSHVLLVFRSDSVI